METEKKIRQVKTVKRYFSELMTFVNLLKYQRKNFKLYLTSYTGTIEIEGDKKKYLYTKDTKKNDFTLLNKLKKEINNSGLYIDNIRTSAIKYFSLTNLKPCKHKIIYNIDITDCYPTTLKNLGFISEEFYNELSKIEKIKKLKTIGQIATKKSVYEFKNGVQTSLSFKENEYLRNVWFCICQQTGEVIHECEINTPSFLFFWFDGIYFKNKNDADRIKRILERNNYRYKEEVLTDFVVKKTQHNLEITYNKKDGVKKFVLPLENKKQEKTSINQKNKKP